MTKRERRTFTEDFKQQMVQLYQNGNQEKRLFVSMTLRLLL